MMLNPNLRSKMMRNEEKTEILELQNFRKNEKKTKKSLLFPFKNHYYFLFNSFLKLFKGPLKGGNFFRRLPYE